MYFLDTNAVIWLYQGEINKFPQPLQEILDSNDLYISPMVKLELQYLLEVKRIKVSTEKVLNYLYQKIGLALPSVSFNVLIEAAIKEDWTRDPFDRLIVSHAKLEKAHLITRDQNILNNYSKALWD